MDRHQLKALSDLKDKLVDTIAPTVVVFQSAFNIGRLIDDDDRETIEHSTTSRDKAARLLAILQTKDKGWETLIQVLKKRNHGSLADQLTRVSDESQNQEASICVAEQLVDEVCLETFITNVARWYSTTLRGVETFEGISASVESVWMDMNFQDAQHRSFNDYTHILEQLQKQNCGAAAVEGPRGSGKTTLAKKIMYDWATAELYPNTKQQIFHCYDLVLYIPAETIFDVDLLLTAVRCYYDVDNNDTNKLETLQICENLRKTALSILIVIDSCDESFAPHIVLRKISSTPNSYPSHLNLIFTCLSCQHYDESLFILRYTILGWSNEEAFRFLFNRCFGDLQGLKNAKSCMDCLPDGFDIGRFPLFLTAICATAKRNTSIEPTNWSQVYKAFVERMLKRATSKDALHDSEASLGKVRSITSSLGQLALFGVICHEYEFEPRYTEVFNLNDQVFRLGFLMEIYDVDGRLLKFKFIHQTIQEHFAAMYALIHWTVSLPLDLDVLEELDNPEGSAKMNVEEFIADEWLFHGSNFNRFYFGLTTEREERASQITKCLQLLIKKISVGIPLLCQISLSLADCSKGDSYQAGCSLSTLLIAGLDSFHEMNKEQLIQLHRRSLLLEKQFNFDVDKINGDLRCGLGLYSIGDSEQSFYIGTPWHLDEAFLLKLDSNSVSSALKFVKNERRSPTTKWLWIDCDGSDAADIRKWVLPIAKLVKHSNLIMTDKRALYYHPYTVFQLFITLQKTDDDKTVSQRLYAAVSQTLGKAMVHKLFGHNQKGDKRIRVVSFDSKPDCAKVRLVSVIELMLIEFLLSQPENCILQ